MTSMPLEGDATMPDLPRAHIRHFTPHRLRLRIPERRYDVAFFETVRNRLAEWGSIDRIDVNPVTASVLIHYSDPTTLLADNASRNDLFVLADLNAETLANLTSWNGTPLIEQARQGMQSVDRRLRQLSGGQGDLRSLVLLGLLGTGFVQLLRGNISAPAITLFWYAGDVLGLWRGDGHGTPPGANERI